jgi:hypothetical protein
VKKLLAATIGLILLVLSTGCGASETVPQLGETPAAAPATPTQAGPPTPTRLVLATPNLNPRCCARGDGRSGRGHPAAGSGRAAGGG